MFGDKHPFLDVPGGSYTTKSMRRVVERLVELGEESTIFSVEMICRDADETGFLDRLITSIPWFFKGEF